MQRMEEIRRRLAAYQPTTIEWDGKPRAAVLVPLHTHGELLHVVFTKRTDRVQHHRGEISFPGGAMDPEDRDLVATALREAEEEIGLPREAVELVGALPPTGTFVTSYKIHPFVGVIRPGHEWEGHRPGQQPPYHVY
jgi:8-oxo-dGTP pyrophosphatase MutT (NUDIX family)